MDANTIIELGKKAKFGKVSEDTLMLLNNYFQAMAEELYKELKGIKIKGKTDKQVVMEFIDVQRAMITNDNLREFLVKKQYEGAMADETLRGEYENLKVKNPQQFK